MSRSVLRFMGTAALGASIAATVIHFQSGESMPAKASVALNDQPGEAPSSIGIRETDARYSAAPRPPKTASIATVSDGRSQTPSVQAHSLPIGKDGVARILDRPIGWPTFDEAEQRFALEQRDPAWSAPTEARILGNLSLISNLALLHVDVECRESLCRVRLLFPPGGETTYSMRQMYARADSIGVGPVSADASFESGGLSVLRLFLRRKGA
ncbi:MAG TPA: hypothetical protein VMR74_09935 [Gammaproteobacteria bacterium]|nr:hypothetical protein [Gammaproteobacteria bacterium]